MLQLLYKVYYNRDIYQSECMCTNAWLQVCFRQYASICIRNPKRLAYIYMPLWHPLSHHQATLPVRESPLLIAVDFPVSAGPAAITAGQPEFTLMTAL